MTRIVTNNVLHPTKRYIENWNQDFRTSDGPNTSTFISLSDLAIPYDSHYTSRIVLPAYTTNYYLNYGNVENVTFLLIKVTYNGNYDYPNEDNYDPLYWYEPNNYNINYYFEGNSGKTYPIGRLLILNGSFTNKLTKIYLNNPLDYDVVLDVLHADISAPIPIPPSSAITISNLYYTDIITNQIICSGTTTTTTTTSTSTTTTTTTTISGTTTTTTTEAPTTTTVIKELMRIVKSTRDEYIVYSSTGETMGLFDYFYDGQWFYDGEESNFVEFTDITGIATIRFYFELNDRYWGALKTDSIDPFDHNNGLYFVDILPDGTPVLVSTTTTTTTTSNITTSTTTAYSGLTTTTTTSNVLIATGSTQFIISEFTITLTGYTIIQNIVPYYTIQYIQNDSVNKTIYLSTLSTFYTLKFLTEFDCNQAYSRMLFAYTSYSDGSCRYLTGDNVYKDGYVIICSTGTTGINITPPIIYYNNPSTGSTWLGSGTTVPYDVFLHLEHSGVTGWTLDNLKTLFISGITDCFDGNIPLSSITFLLYMKGSVIPLSGITESGVYDITISVTDSASNTITNNILDINVNDQPPIIVFYSNILNSGITSYTDLYTGATSAITSGIYIPSGFTFILSDFGASGSSSINRIDIIDNVVEYVYDIIDNINKYMLNILIVNTSSVFTEVSSSGDYCVKIFIGDSGGNLVERYLIMRVYD